MGRTRFSGPVYGAKQTLFQIGPFTTSSGAASTVAAATIIPAGEDWYATEFQVFRGSTGSSQAGFWVTDDSSVVSSLTLTSTTVGGNTITVITPTGGEKEGARMLQGSTIRFQYSDAASQAAQTGVFMSLHGYRRFVDSSRAE